MGMLISTVTLSTDGGGPELPEVSISGLAVPGPGTAGVAWAASLSVSGRSAPTATSDNPTGRDVGWRSTADRELS